MAFRRTKRWPFRQSDPEWQRDVIWDRKKVMEVHRRYNPTSRTRPETLLSDHRDGNNISNEGCLITCLAMVLRMLATSGGRWTPGTLNKKAKTLLYYSESGLSMVPLYADLVADVSKGEVQLCTQEQYLAGEQDWPRTYASGCAIVRAYRTLSPNAQRDFAVMLKIGTHDDTFASHYVLVDPAEPGACDDDDVPLLDPVQPSEPGSRRWMLSDSYKYLLRAADIGTELRRVKIRPLQISGVWAFARWRSSTQRSLGAALLRAVVQESG